MYCESITRLTADNTGGFARLRPENVNEVFQSLIKMGDVAHSLGDESIPTPQMTLMAQMYAETMLTHLRLPLPDDVDNFAESVDFYDLDSTFQESSPWLNVESLDNVRVDSQETSRASHRRQMRRYPPTLEHRQGHARGARQVLRRSARSHGSLVFGTVSSSLFFVCARAIRVT